jgi:chitodextrinase
MSWKPRSVARWGLVVSLVATTPSSAQTGPVGWWKLDEGAGTTTADSSGNSNTGTLTNGPTWATGRVGPGALTFSGATPSVAISGAGSLANLYLTGVTVSAWIKPAGLGGGSGGRIVDKDNNDAGWFFSMGTNNTIKFSSDQFNGTEPSRSTASSVITLNAWQHVAATWDGTTSGNGIHVYINGVESTGGTIISGSGTPYDDSGTPLTLGNRPTDNARGFNGVIDEIRVYNRVLTGAEIQALADATAPTAPSSLTATAASSTQVNLSWTASTDNVGVSGYLLERCQGSGCSTFTQIATPTGTSYSDTGRTASTSYTYRVRATDANSNLSAYSSSASVTTPAGSGDTQAPTAPASLAVLASSSSEVDLTWIVATDNVGVTAYLIERCTGTGCTFSQIGSIAAAPFYDTTAVASTTYSYRVRAQDGAGNLGSYSNVISTTTPVSNPDCN